MDMVEEIKESTAYALPVCLLFIKKVKHSQKPHTAISNLVSLVGAIMPHMPALHETVLREKEVEGKDEASELMMSASF